MNPYQSLPSTAFWRSGVADRNMLAIRDLWTPKYAISKEDVIVTAGSCFAQHISRHMRDRGYRWLDAEPAPPLMLEDDREKFNYGVFSFRTGNIYTVALLRQWLIWALNRKPVPDETWEKDGRYYDPFRPAVEAGGFASVEELKASRETNLRAIRRALRKANVFVFTLGLTEAWVNEEDDTVYPMCPGTIAGEFDPERHAFKNFTYPEIRKDLRRVVSLLQKTNPDLRILLTVSPVPLTATASGEHVLTATTYSKSVLRAVAGDIAASSDSIDYFPSYEMISSFPFRGAFYMPNLRSVTKEGVDFVMETFFASLGEEPTASNDRRDGEVGKRGADATDFVEDDVVCEDAILEYYNEK